MVKKKQLKPNGDTVVLLKNGQVWNCHPKSVCAGSTIPCLFHSPTEHHMDTWPLDTRYDRAFWYNTKTKKPSYYGLRPGPYGDSKDNLVLLLLLERRCPHGVSHPDPDSVVWLSSVYSNAWGVHDCDGCCATESET